LRPWFFSSGDSPARGGKEKQSIAMERLEDALLYANQDIKDHWRWYKKQYFRRMKNDKEGNGGA
jgi:hypothetical protein